MFKGWLHGDIGHLCIHGAPGCGKSVLCSTLIEVVRSYTQSDPRHGFAYFYSDPNNLPQQPTRVLITALLWQLASRNRKVQDLQVRVKTIDGGSYKALLECLERVLVHFGRTYVFVDAVDARQSTGYPEAILPVIRVLQMMPGISLLVTSRDRLYVPGHPSSPLLPCETVNLCDEQAHTMELYAIDTYARICRKLEYQNRKFAEMIKATQPLHCTIHDVRFSNRLELSNHMLLMHLPDENSPYRKVRPE